MSELKSRWPDGTLQREGHCSGHKGYGRRLVADRKIGGAAGSSHGDGVKGVGKNASYCC